VRLAVSPAAPEKVFALVGQLSPDKILGLFVWNDDSGTWDRLAGDAVLYPAPNEGIGAQAWYNLAIAVSPVDPRIIYLGAQAVMRSLDGGKTFAQSSASSTSGFLALHLDVHSLVFDKTDPSVLYAGTDGGVSRASDQAISWFGVNTGLSVTQYYPGISVSADGRIVLAGSQDNGTHKYDLGSAFWIEVAGGDGGYTALDPRSDGVFFWTTNWFGGSCLSIVRERPGKLLTDLPDLRNTGINCSDNALFIPPLVMDPVNPSTLYFGTHRLYRTNNDALNWEPISGPLSRDNISPISTIAIAKANPSVVYVGTSDGTV
jgi:hypothetical protein